MKKSTYEVAEKIVDKINKLEKIIFELQDLNSAKDYKNFKIVAVNTNQADPSLIINNMIPNFTKTVELKEGDMATEIFSQDILEYYINTLNLELEELKKELELL